MRQSTKRMKQYNSIGLMKSLAALLALSAHTQDVSAFSAVSPAYETIRSSPLFDPTTGRPSSAPILPDPSSGGSTKKSLVVILPQLGEFDSSEYCQYLVAAKDKLDEADIDLKVIGIGNEDAAAEFCTFTGLPRDSLWIDPDAALHSELSLHAGPNWDVPEWASDDLINFLFKAFLLPGGIPDDPNMLRPVARSWLNYLLMCAGIGAPGTLREILRGYFGDYKAPECFRDDDVVKAGFITIGPGVGPTQLGPLKYTQWFADEKGYQRPVELATVRLKNMCEVLTKWDIYVSNPLAIDKRGATFLFDSDGSELYTYKSRGVLTYSETMPRPLKFLAPYIGEDFAKNPLGLPDNGGGDLKKGRGVLKPAGKAMGFLSILFKLENKLQAKLLGSSEVDFAAARKEIEDTIAGDKIVVYTYGLSPFSTECTAVLDEIGAQYKKVELGLEWFLLDKEKSTLRAELLEMTGQSSLPHVFIDGKHVGGLFTGSADGSSPGLAGLKESGELKEMVA